MTAAIRILIVIIAIVTFLNYRNNRAVLRAILEIRDDARSANRRSKRVAKKTARVEDTARTALTVSEKLLEVTNPVVDRRVLETKSGDYNEV